MTILVLDRDGTLFDTCELNFRSYSNASENLKVNLDENALQASICKGESFSTFQLKVWSKASSVEREALKSYKSEFFSRNLSLVRVNPELISLIESNGDSVYMATRATLESTNTLLEHFGVRIQKDNVYSTQTYPGSDKVSIMQNILEIGGGLPASIRLIDDSMESIKKVSAAGFSVQLYPHYCSFKG